MTVKGLKSHFAICTLHVLYRLHLLKPYMALMETLTEWFADSETPSAVLAVVR